VQQTPKGLRPRRLLLPEVAPLFDATEYGVKAAVDLNHPKAASALGGGANGDVFMFQLEQFLQHMRPPNPYRPKSVEDVQDPAVAIGLLNIL
jgi:hypothetical protein